MRVTLPLNFMMTVHLFYEKNNINRTPFFVGGTGLYFRAIEHGLSPIPTIDNQIRKKIEFELKVQGLSYLYDQLKKIDSELASSLHPHDKQRIMRGLEVRGHRKNTVFLIVPKKDASIGKSSVKVCSV